MLNEIITYFQVTLPKYLEFGSLTLPAAYVFSKLGGHEFYRLSAIDPFTRFRDPEPARTTRLDQPAAAKQVGSKPGRTVNPPPRRKPEPRPNPAPNSNPESQAKPEGDYRTVWPETGFYHTLRWAARMTAPVPGLDEASQLLRLELQRLKELGRIVEFMPSMIWNDTSIGYETVFTMLLPGAKVVLAKAEALAGKLYCNRLPTWRRELPNGKVFLLGNLAQALAVPRNQVREKLQQIGLRHARIKTLLVLTEPESSLHLGIGEQAPKMDICYLDSLHHYLAQKTVADDFTVISAALKNREQAYRPRYQTGEFA